MTILSFLSVGKLVFTRMTQWNVPFCASTTRLLVTCKSNSLRSSQKGKYHLQKKLKFRIWNFWISKFWFSKKTIPEKRLIFEFLRRSHSASTNVWTTINGSDHLNPTSPPCRDRSTIGSTSRAGLHHHDFNSSLNTTPTSALIAEFTESVNIGATNWCHLVKVTIDIDRTKLCHCCKYYRAKKCCCAVNRV